MKFFIKLIQMFINSILHILLEHWQTLASQLDPIILISNTEKHLNPTSRRFLLFPLALTLFTYFYGIFGLHYEATRNALNSLASLQCSNHIFTHQMVPQAIRHQCDFIVLINQFFAIVGVFTALLLTRPIRAHFRFCHFRAFFGEQKNVIKLFINGKALPKAETKKMLTVRRRMRMTAASLSGSFYLLVLLFFLGNVWLNDVYVRSASSLFFWTVVFPLMEAYFIYG